MGFYSELPKRYRNICYDANHAASLLRQKRIAVIPYNLWQKVNNAFGKPTCLRGSFDDKNYGRIVVIHRYPPKP